MKVRKTKNLSQAKKFSEMIEMVVNKYHNNQIDSAQVLEELSAIAKEMRLEDNKASEDENEVADDFVPDCEQVDDQELEDDQDDEDEKNSE